jgi:Protein of unknown function (DUF1571)
MYLGRHQTRASLALMLLGAVPLSAAAQAPSRARVRPREILRIQHESPLSGAASLGPIVPWFAPDAEPGATSAADGPPIDMESESPPIYRVAETTLQPAAGQVSDLAPAVASGTSLREQLAPRPGEHPLLPAVRWARTGLEQLSRTSDYSCTMIKRERINGHLGESESMFVKIRHQPFSVYMYFLGPPKVKGREALYVEGANDSRLIAHETGIKHRLIGTVSLRPDSTLAMTGNRYPITEAGLLRLTQRLIEVGEHESQFGECDVQYFPGAKLNGRPCTCIQVTHPVPRREFIFHQARIFVDDEWNVPVRYEAYGWPSQPGEPPPLEEEYTYVDLKFNNGFSDLDFDRGNATYGFR